MPLRSISPWASCALQPTVTLEPQHRQGGKSLKIVISSKCKKINRWGRRLGPPSGA